MSRSGFVDDFLPPIVTEMEISNCLDRHRQTPQRATKHTFEGTEDFNLPTYGDRKNMFGFCDDPFEVNIRTEDGKGYECVGMEESRARRAMIRMLRRSVKPHEVGTPRQTTETCWFFSALTAMFLSDMGRVNNVRLRETMILGRFGHERTSNPIPKADINPLRLLNMVIHLLLDGTHVANHGNDTALYTRQAELRHTEQHLNALRVIGDLNNVNWFSRFDDAHRPRIDDPNDNIFGYSHPIAFIMGITHMTHGNAEDFVHVSKHGEPLPWLGADHTTIVRYGTIPRHGRNTPHEIEIGSLKYKLDSMIVYSELLGRQPPHGFADNRVHHATACIHLGGKQYWFDSNDKIRPKEYNWYDLLTGRDVKRTLGNDPDKQINYNVHKYPTVLVYQRVTGIFDYDVDYDVEAEEDDFHHVHTPPSLPLPKKGGIVSGLKSVVRKLRR